MKWLQGLSNFHNGNGNGNGEHESSDNETSRDDENLPDTVDLRNKIKLTKNSERLDLGLPKHEFKHLQGNYGGQANTYKFLQKHAPKELQWAYLRALKNYKKSLLKPK